MSAGNSETVTMTTHGERLRDVWLAIESIGRGTRRPGRIVLWLDAPVRLPWRLRRLRQRGLEIRRVPPGWGVHTKYWPFLLEEDLSGPLVTADDDIVYPPHWLDDLVRMHRRFPNDVIAHRAHHVAMRSPESFVPYSDWPKCLTDQPAYSHFATSVSGQLLPSALQVALRSEGDRFLELAPTADDVWINRCAVKHGFPTRQVVATPLHWWFIPGSQTSGLNAVNVFGGANDRQMELAHDSTTRERLWSDAIRVS